MRWLICVKKLLFTAIRSCLTIFIISLQAMFGTGWERATGKRYSCDGKLSLDKSTRKNDNKWFVLPLSITTEDKLSKRD